MVEDNTKGFDNFVKDNTSQNARTHMLNSEKCGPQQHVLYQRHGCYFVTNTTISKFTVTSLLDEEDDFGDKTCVLWILRKHTKCG